MIIREYKPEDREGIGECILTLQNLEYKLEPHLVTRQLNFMIIMVISKDKS